jgi:amidophosphoribosyltransferase
MAIGHNRYSTTGSDNVQNASPMIVDSELGQFAIAHNGNLTNTLELKELLPKNIIFNSTTDSEVLGHVIAQAKGSTFEDKIYNSMEIIRGAYSVTLLTKNAIYAFRDPHGFRPLSLANYKKGFAVSSETCAFGTVGAKRIRDINPGEIVKVTKKGIESKQYPPRRMSFCMFEYIYFARPDSVINGQSVYRVREGLGRFLGENPPIGADMVIGMPDSGIPAAIGFSIASGIPYREGLIKNKYIGRTFINPNQNARLKAITLKLNALRSVITDKSLVLVDDSIVRGNTMKKTIKLLKDKGAKEVHVRITCPPIKYPCYFGVDFPSFEELTANNQTLKELQKDIGADSLEFISLEQMVEATRLPKDSFCLACFNGEYPYEMEKKSKKAKEILEVGERK